MCSPYITRRASCSTPSPSSALLFAGTGVRTASDYDVDRTRMYYCTIPFPTNCVYTIRRSTLMVHSGTSEPFQGRLAFGDKRLGTGASRHRRSLMCITYNTLDHRSHARRQPGRFR